MDVPAKANRILSYVAVCFFLIALRVVYLTVFEYETMQEKARLPKRRVEYSVGPRGTIRDRFGIPLAINQIQYDATILYSRVKDLPRIKFIQENGKRKKVYPRKEHIKKLSLLLAQKLSLDPQHIEDKIYSEAALFPNTPCVLASNIDEKTYYSLKHLEQKFPGIFARENTKRHYPMGKVAGDSIGFLGALNANEQKKIAEEIDELESYLEAYTHSEPAPLPEGYISLHEVEEGLHALKEKAYAQSGLIGKAGIERMFDKELRGGIGFTHYEVDTTGRRINELPLKKKALSGKQVQLTLSYELQNYAESLLIRHEQERDKEYHSYGKEHDTIENPWIKGGAIVALEPRSGEVVALASYPRLDPSAFIEKDAEKVHAQLETSLHIQNIWSGKVPLEREFFDQKELTVKKQFLDWDTYLHKIISPKSSLWTTLKKVVSVRSAKSLHAAATALLDLSEQPSMAALIDALYTPKMGMQLSRKVTSEPLRETLLKALSNHEEETKKWKGILDSYLLSIPCNDDKLLLLDILQLPVSLSTSFEDPILDCPLSLLFSASQELAQISDEVLSNCKKAFRKKIFTVWREKEFPTYLKGKRLEEKEKGSYQKPYTYYLRGAERKLFRAFWEENKEVALLSSLFASHEFVLQEDIQLKKEYPSLKKVLSLVRKKGSLLTSLQTYETLTKPLYGLYRNVHTRNPIQQDLARAFYPKHGYFFAKPLSYQHAAQQGSLFKVVTAYEGLMKRYNDGYHNTLNPLTIVDEIGGAKDPFKGLMLGYTIDGKPLYRRHKGGTLPRSHGNVGKVDLGAAMERSSNIYFSILAGDIIESPASLYTTARKFGFGEKTGVELPYEYKGTLPRDLRFNKTGLYQFAIGQHTLTVTPLQSAQMFATIANKGVRKSLSIVKKLQGVESLDSDPFTKESYPYQEILASGHIHFPLFTQSVRDKRGLDIQTISQDEEAACAMPDEVHEYLLDSLYRVVHAKHGSAHPFRIRALYKDHTVLSDYVKTKPYMVGKTSTAEYYYCPHCNSDAPPVRVKDIWFGGISYESKLSKNAFIKQNRFEDPELVVIVYLRHGDFGKEAAPLAAQVMKKWKEIKSKYYTDSTKIVSDASSTASSISHHD